jgi:hypothetical protein
MCVRFIRLYMSDLKAADNEPNAMDQSATSAPIPERDVYVPIRKRICVISGTLTIFKRIGWSEAAA